MHAAAVRVLSDASPSATPSPTSTPSPVTPLKIMTLGDSLTMGYGSSDGNGYRRELGRLLGAAGVPVTFTFRGAVSVGTSTVQDLRAGIDGWIATDQPNIILLDSGTNNASGQKTGMTGIEAAQHDLLNRIFADAPNVTVYVATIQYSSAPWSNNQVYNNQYWITGSWQHPGKAYLASMDAIPVCGFLFDNIHPRDAGYDAMARQWYRAMTPQMNLPAISPDAWDGKPVPRPGFERPTVMSC